MHRVLLSYLILQQQTAVFDDLQNERKPTSTVRYTSTGVKTPRWDHSTPGKKIPDSFLTETQKMDTTLNGFYQKLKRKTIIKEGPKTT